MKTSKWALVPHILVRRFNVEFKVHYKQTHGKVIGRATLKSTLKCFKLPYSDCELVCVFAMKFVTSFTVSL